MERIKLIASGDHTLERAQELDLYSVEYIVKLEYGNGVPACAASAFREFLSRESCVIRKKSQRGYTELDIIPMIKKWTLEEQANTLVFWARIADQNPGWSFSLVIDMLVAETPELRPDSVHCDRLEVYRELGKIF